MSSNHDIKSHVVLLGDSILDNEPYVGKGPSVTQWLAKKMSRWNSKVTLCAIDGDVMSGIPQQLDSVPDDASFLVLSIGGNDCLGALSRLEGGGNPYNPIYLYSFLTEFLEEYRKKYRDVLEQFERKKIPFCVLNIYYPLFNSIPLKALSYTGLWFVNRIIRQESEKFGVPLIDIASIFEEKDYANPIEPGVSGGDKITNNIVDILEKHDFSTKKQVVYHSKEYSDIDVSDMEGSFQVVQNRSIDTAINQPFRESQTQQHSQLDFVVYFGVSSEKNHFCY